MLVLWEKEINCTIIPSFLPSSLWVFSGFQSQGGFLDLHTPSPAHSGVLRFTYSATPADLLAGSMVSEPFSIHVLAHVQASIGGAGVQIIFMLN